MSEEYAEVYGVPFNFLKTSGNTATKPPKIIHRVHSIPEREQYEIHFPRVEGYRYELNEAKLAARQVGLAILSTLKANLGSLNKVKRVIKVLGMVNATPEFGRHPFVINGCSELFAKVWGEENGIGVRSAVGMGSLPDNIPVEIEALFEVH